MMFDLYPENRAGLLGLARRATAIGFDDSQAQQFITELRGLKADAPRWVYRAQSFGLSAVPPAGSEGIVIALGGRSDRLLGLGFEHKDYRPKDSPAGTSVLYDDKGNVIFVKGANGIEIKAGVGKVTVTPAPGQNVYLGGDVGAGAYARVITESGPAVNVYAKV